MSELKIKGDLNAGRDNVINFGDTHKEKAVDDMSPDELREKDKRELEEYRNCRRERMRKSKIWALVLTIGAAGSFVLLLFLRELYIDYTGGASPSVKIIAYFIWDTLKTVPSQRDFLLMLPVVVVAIFGFLLLPITMIKDYLFGEDEFMCDKKAMREKIKNRLVGLGEKP